MNKCDFEKPLKVKIGITHTYIYKPKTQPKSLKQKKMKNENYTK